MTMHVIARTSSVAEWHRTYLTRCGGWSKWLTDASLFRTAEEAYAYLADEMAHPLGLRSKYVTVRPVEVATRAIRELGS